MGYPNVLVFLVIVLLEATIGLLSNLFMILCLCIKKFQMKNLRTYSRILIPLNVSSICYTAILLMNLLFCFLWSDLYSKANVFSTFMYLTLYSITSCMWLAAGLCVFYFVKIIPSQSGLFTTLKRRIDALVWWLIIAAKVVSLGGGFLSMLLSNPNTKQMNSSLTMSELIEESSAENVKFAEIVLILNSLPILTILMTTFGSAWFLKVYNYQIQKNMVTSGNAGVRDYRAAIQTMVGLLVLFTIISLCNILLLLNVFSYLSWSYWMCMVFLFSFATVLPAILIYGNPKLKEAFRHMFTSK